MVAKKLTIIGNIYINIGDSVTLKNVWCEKT